MSATDTANVTEEDRLLLVLVLLDALTVVIILTRIVITTAIVAAVDIDTVEVLIDLTTEVIATKLEEMEET